MELIEQFKQYLLSQKKLPSRITIKNYKADVGQFIRWFEAYFNRKFEPQAVTPQIIELYKNPKNQPLNLSVRSLERHLSSLRKFFHFLKLEGLIRVNPFELDAKRYTLDADPWHLKDFKNYLYIYNASHLTIKNYIIDVRQFLKWVEEVTGIEEAFYVKEKNVFGKINAALLEEYKNRLLTTSFSPASVNRKLSSLRRYFGWAQTEGLVKDQSSVFSQSILDKPTRFAARRATDKLEAENRQQRTDNGYSHIPPLRLWQKILIGLDLLFDAVMIAPLAKAIEQGDYLLWKIKGKPIFGKRAVTGKTKISVSNLKKELYAPYKVSTKYFPLSKKIFFHLRHTRPKWYQTYHSYSITHYFHLAILIIFTSALGFGLYQTYIQEPQAKKSLLAAAPTSPPRILSFQGRLTDAQDNPITAGKLVRFQIYSSPTASGSGSLLWQEADKIAPDSDGIFSILLGNTTTICPDPLVPATGPCLLPQSLFAQNAALYLGVTIENDSELAPRQQLATVAYAVNAEVLQGMPPITDPTLKTNTNAILALNSSGTLAIGGTATTTFQTTNGQFKLTGQPLLLTTNPGTSQNINIEPDGIGKIDLRKPLQNTSNNNNISSASGALEIDDSLLILATSSGQSALIINQNGTGPLISASTSGIAKFTVNNTGRGYFADSVGIGTTNSYNFKVQVEGSIGPNSDLNHNLGSSSYRWSRIYVNETIPGSSGTQGWWQRNSQALSPTNITDDLLVGGIATASAKFQVYGLTGNTTTAGDLAVNGGDLTSTSTTFNLLNSTVTTLNIGGAATAVSIGASTGTTTVNGDLIVSGGDIGSALTSITMASTGWIGLGSGAGRIVFTDATPDVLDIETANLDINANTLSGTTAAIDFSNFDVATTGNITVAADQGLDTNAAGTLALGNTTATTVNIGNTAATTIAIGAGGALTRTINLGTGTGADTINIGTGGTGTDIIRIGDSLADLALADAQWSITTAGLITTAGDLAVNGGDITTTATTWNFDVGNTGTIYFRDGTNTLMSLADGGDDGNLTITGDTTLGNAAADTITFTGVINSDIIKDSGSTLNIGSSSVRWSTGYFDTLNATNLVGTIIGGSTNAATWTINADNLTSNAEIAAVAFETGDAAFNAVLQWNAANDVSRISGFDNYNLFNYPVAIFSQVSGANQTFTSGSLFKYSQPAAHAITQSGAFIGTDVDFSSNITVPNSSSGNQTGAKMTLKDGGASATSIGFQTAGTLDYGLDIGGTVGTADIRLSNGETIDNLSDNQINLNLGTSGTLKLTGGATVVSDQAIVALLNTTTTTLSIGGAATTFNIGTTDSVTRAINLGTGTGADTINIGTGGTGADTIAIGGGVGTVAVNSGDWDISTVGAMTNIDSLANTSADLALLTTTSGNITLTPAATTGLANVLTGNLKVGNDSPTQTQDGEDAYIEGMLEVDGTTYLDGAVNLGGTTTWTLAAGGQLVVDAATNDNTTTSGVVNFDVDSATTNNIGLSLDYQSQAGAAALTQYASKIDVTIDANATYDNTVYGQYIGMTQTDTGATAWGLYVTGEDKNYFSGDVGVGTTSPQDRLHVRDLVVNNAHYNTTNSNFIFEGGDASAQILSDDSGSWASNLLLTSAPSSGDNKHWSLSHRGSTASDRFDLMYITTTTGGNITAGTITNVLTALTGGDVGIGTTAPNNKLEVTSTTTPQLRVAYDTSAYFTTAVAGTTGAVTFDTNGTVPSFSFSDAVTANTFSSSGVTITGGSIIGTTIGASNPTTGAFTTLTSSGNTTLGTGASGTHTYSTGAGSTTTLGNSTGALTLASGGTSAWTNTSGNLTISTATTGNLNLQAVGTLALSTSASNSNITFAPNGTGSVQITSGTTTGTGTSAGLSLASSTLTNGVLENITSTSTTQASGKLLSLDHTATYTTTVANSGNLLNLSRALTTNTGGALTTTGAVAAFASNCTQTAGTCTDSANVLTLTQSYASATGDVLAISNSGTGKDISGTSNTWNISKAGAGVFVGVNSGSGLIQGTGGLTLTGTTLINNTLSANTTIGNTAGGTITIGALTGSDLILQDAQWNITGAGVANFASIGTGTAGSGAFTTLSATPTTNTTALTLTGTNVTSANLAYFNSKNTSGTIFNVAYGAAATLGGALTGQALDLSTNVTNAAQGVTGVSLALPVTTAASTTTTKGISLTSGAFTTAAAATTSTWTGLDITMPNITQGAGSTLTSTGLKITGGTVTSGTSYGLIVDSNAGSVGIGTAGPGAKLEVRGDFANGEQIRITDPDQTGELFEIGYDNVSNYATLNTYVGAGVTNEFRLNYAPNSTDDSFVFNTNAVSNALVIETGGSVGIGTTSPSSPLNVYYYLNTAAPTNTVYVDTNMAYPSSGTDYSTKGIYSLIRGSSNYAHQASAIKGEITATGNFNNGVIGVEGVVSAASSEGNYGLKGYATDGGFTNAGVWAAVAGTGASSGGYNPSNRYGNYAFYGTTTTTGASATNVGLYVSASGANTNYAAIFDQGNVGIGTTSPGRTIDVVGNWGGNVVTNQTTSGGVVATENVTAAGLIYSVGNNSGTTDADTTITFNISGVPNTAGTFIFIKSYAQKGATTNARTSTVQIQINSGTIRSTVATPTQTGANTTKENYILAYVGNTWNIIGTPSSSDTADLAEWIKFSGIRPQEGELVTIADEEVKIKRADLPYDKKLIGVISTNPHTVMGPQTPDSVRLTLSGKVPAIVSSLNGNLFPGDPITSSTLPGVGMKATKSGPTVGKALEGTKNWNEQNCPVASSLETINWPEDDGANSSKPCFRLPDGTYVGKILVFVNVSWYDPDVYLTDTGDLSIQRLASSEIASSSGNYTLYANKLNAFIERVGAFAELAVANLRAGLIEAQEITTQSLTVATENITIGGQSLKDYIVSIVNEAISNSQFSIFNQFSNLNAQKIVSPLAEIDQIHTNIISPLASDSIVIKLASSSGTPRFEIQNASGSAVATIDAAGNARFAGDLEARRASLSGQLSSNQLTSNEATIAGTLRANTIIANNIEGLEAKVSTIAANYITTNNQNKQDQTNSFSSLATSLPAITTDFVNIATLASQLTYIDRLNATTATFTQGLMSFGPASFADVSVVGQFSVGGSLILADNSINVLGSNLELQPLKQGGISMMGGLVAIDTEGNLVAQGNMTVKGVLAANIISPIPDQDLIIKLASSDQRLASSSSSLVVQDASGSAILAVNQQGDLTASGSGSFADIFSKTFNIVRGAQADTSMTETIATASAGTATIIAGETERTVISPYVDEKSLLYITPTSDTQGTTPYVARQTKDSFTIQIPQRVYKDINLNWWIVN